MTRKSTTHVTNRLPPPARGRVGEGVDISVCPEHIITTTPKPKPQHPKSSHGFTLIELLVVLAIIATLLTIALPNYFGGVDRSKETALRQDLLHMREALDKFYADTGKYPDTLQELIDKRYLRAIPPDPITDSVSTWIIVPPKDGGGGKVFNIRSGAPGKAADGTAYAEW